jgi:hypothetical protein
MEEALQCRAAGAVVTELMGDDGDLTATRRLALAAGTGGGIAFPRPARARIKLAEQVAGDDVGARIVAFEQYGRGLEGPRAAQHISSPLVRPRAGQTPLVFSHTLPHPNLTHPGPRAAALRAFWCRSPPGPLP